MGIETKTQGTELAITFGIAFGMFGALMLVSYVMPIVLTIIFRRSPVSDLEIIVPRG